MLRAAAGQMQLQSKIPLAMLRTTVSVLPPVGMFFHIPVIYVHCDIIKQLSANLICLSVKDNDIDHYLVFQQKFADGIDCNLQILVFGITVNTGGNQRKATD